jgi:hypothetical protein
MFADRLVLSALDTTVQIITVYYTAPSSVPKQHTEWDDDYLQSKSLSVSTQFQ